MGFDDWARRLQMNLFDAPQVDDGQEPVKLPDVQPGAPSLVQAPSMQADIAPPPPPDPHQAAVEAIFGKAKPNFAINPPSQPSQRPVKLPKTPAPVSTPAFTQQREAQPVGGTLSRKMVPVQSPDDGNSFSIDTYEQIGKDSQFAQPEARRKTAPTPDDDAPTYGRRLIRLDEGTGRALRTATDPDAAKRMLTDAFIGAHKGVDRDAAQFAFSLVGPNATFDSPGRINYDDQGYSAEVDVPKWFNIAVEAYKTGGADAAIAAVRDRMAREAAYTERQQQAADARAREEQAYAAEVNPSNPTKSGAFARIAETEAEKGLRTLSGNVAGLAGAFAGAAGFDSADRYLTDIYESRKGLNRVAEEGQGGQARQSGLKPWQTATAKALGGLPIVAGEMAAGPGGLIAGRMIEGADKPITESGPGVFTAPAEIAGMNWIAEKGARPVAQKLADSLVPRLVQTGMAEGLARTGAEVAGTLTNVVGRSAEGAAFNVAVEVAHGKTDPNELREAAITGALLPNILGLAHTRIETQNGAFPNVRPAAGELGPMPEAGNGPRGLNGGHEPLTPEEVVSVVEEAARTQPNHPVVRALLAAGIEPNKLRTAPRESLEALSVRLEAWAKMESQIKQLESTRGEIQQQAQNAMDAQRMGRVPAEADQTQAQNLPVVEQQMLEAQQVQQTIVQDLAENVSPLLRNLAKVATGKPVESLSDVSDDATGNLLTEIRRAGGIAAKEGAVESGEINRLSPKEVGTTGLINRKGGGESADLMRERMASEGLTTAETAHQFIEEVESATKQQKKENTSLDEYQRSQMSEAEAAEADLLETTLADRSAPFTQAYRALENPKVVHSPKLEREFIAAADKLGFSDEFIERQILDARRRRGLIKDEDAVPAEISSGAVPGAGSGGDNRVGETGNLKREGTPQKSLSQYSQMVAANKSDVDRLYDINLNSPEAQSIIQKLRDYSVDNEIESRHLGNLLNAVRNYQTTHLPEGMKSGRPAAKPSVTAEKPRQPLVSRSNPVPEWMRARNIGAMNGAEVTEFVQQLRAEKARQDAQGWETIDPGLRKTTLRLKEAAEAHRNSLKAQKKDVPRLIEAGNVPKTAEDREAARVRRGEIEEKAAKEAAKIGAKPETKQAGAKMYDQPVSDLDDSTIENRIRSNQKIEETMKGDVEYQKSEVAKKRRDYVEKLKEEQRKREKSPVEQVETAKTRIRRGQSIEFEGHQWEVQPLENSVLLNGGNGKWHEWSYEDFKQKTGITANRPTPAEMRGYALRTYNDAYLDKLSDGKATTYLPAEMRRQIIEKLKGLNQKAVTTNNKKDFDDYTTHEQSITGRMVRYLSQTEAIEKDYKRANVNQQADALLKLMEMLDAPDGRHSRYFAETDDELRQKFQQIVTEGTVARNPLFADEIRGTIDQQAHEAATSPKNDLPEPTEAQKEAGNYKKGHINFRGLDITIENPEGSKRSGIGPNGKPWEVEMSAHYGYIRRTEGADGEQVDVYIGSNPASDKVYVIDQVDAKTGKFDEHKVILGADTKTEAEKLYDAHFDDKKGPDRRGAVTPLTMDEFKDWLKNEDNTKPLGLSETKAPELKVGDSAAASAVLGEQKVGPAAEASTVVGKSGEGDVSAKSATVDVYAPGQRSEAENANELESKLRNEEKILQSQAKAMDALFDALDEPAPDRVWTENDVRKAIAAGKSDDIPERVLSKYPDLYDQVIGVKKGDSDERLIDSKRSDDRRPESDRGKSIAESAGNAPAGQGEQGKGTKPESVSGKSGTGRRGSRKSNTPSLFDESGAIDQSVREQGNREIEAVEAITEPLSAGEAVVQAAAAGLPEVVDEQPENKAPELVEPEPEAKPAKSKPLPLAILTGASFTITPETIAKIQSGGAATKYKQNVEAIRTMRQILMEGRRATVEEQETMALYAGFGGIKQLFSAAGDYSMDYKTRQQWFDRQKELKELIGEEAYKAASKSTMNAHYTDPRIVKTMWDIVRRLGFERGRALEPSMGSGNFLGLVPADLREKTTFTGVELDNTTGEIARLLYPDANISIQGFEDLKAPDNFFDLAIGNVPFGDYRISDNRYNKLLPQIHNYFFLKALDKVRPGGIVAFITSTGTMDSRRAKNVREELAKQADLVSVVRFPAETFGKTALTSVVTDLVILRKRLPGEEAKDLSWVNSSEVSDPRGDGFTPIRLNDWLAKNRQNMLGEFNGANRMYPGRANVDRTDDFEQRLADAIERMPENVMSDYARTVQSQMRAAGAKAKEGAYVVQDGRLMQNVSGGLAEVDATPDRIRRVEGLTKIRDKFDSLIDGEMGRTALMGQRKELNSVYDAFVAKHGPINDKKNREALAGDPDLPRLMALEDWDSKKKTAKKQPIFAKSTVIGSRANAKPATVQEALVKSFESRGEIVLSEMAADLGLTEETIGDELSSKGIAFQNPNGNWEIAPHYLSGNVRRKLSEARIAAATDPAFQANVDALERVVPRDLHHSEISVEMGAPWMEPDIIAKFVADLFGDNPSHVKIHYDRALGVYTTGFDSYSKAAHSSTASTIWGTADAPFQDLLSLILSGKTAKISDTVKTPDGTISVFNPQKTQAANTKLDAIKKRFREWIWEDDARRTRLVDRYNEQFNSLRPAEYDVKWMLDEDGRGVVPGMAAGYKLRGHQMAAVFRGVIERRGLLAHEVGTGKTFAIIATASELKRLGIARKPAIAVPKKVIPAFAQAVRDAFPLLKLHVVDSRDAEKRNTSMSQVATGDHDLILMTHDNMDMLKMRPEFEAQQLQIELDEVNAVYDAIRAENRNAGKKSPEGRILAQIEKRREKLAAKIKDALTAERKDDAITFEDTGIDFLFVDEFHKYKSLPVITGLGQVKGVPTGDSQRAMNMLMRARYLQSIQKGGGLIAATGTPVSNSLAEAWIMAKFLQPDLLEESGVQSFDAWVRQFAETVPALEMDATGKWKNVSRLSKFRNLPELQVMSRMTLDVKTAKETGILDVRPKRIDRVIEVPQSKAQAAYMQVLRERADAIRSGLVEPYEDNYLVVSSDGMLMASDPRLVLPGFKEEGGKIKALAENVLRVLKEKPGSVQMIFSDSGVSPNAWGFHLYDEIIKKLEAGGIPRDKIINFSKLDSDAKVEKAVERLNSGDALVAIGHRENMGTGVNAQKRMSAIHQFDVPWKPALVEQSEARGWRQGNDISQMFPDNPGIEILSYVTRGSFDAVKWSTVARKQQAITAFMQKPGLERELVDTDDDALSYDQIAAAASGDGDYLRKAELDAKVFKLAMMEQSHNSEALARKQEVPRIEGRIEALTRRAEKMEALAEVLKPIREQDFSYKTPKGEAIEDKKEAAKNLVSNYLFSKDKTEKTTLGYYKGMRLTGDGWGNTVIHVPFQNGIEELTFNVNTQVFEGTIQSIEKKIAAYADDADSKHYREVSIPALKNDLEQLKSVTDTPFPFTEQLAQARKKLDAVNKRLKAKEAESKAEGEPLHANGTDVRAVAALGRQVRRGLREKALKPADVARIIEEELPRIEADARDQADVWQEVQRQRAAEFLAGWDDDTGLAGMAITAQSAMREQESYDPDIDGPGPAASLGKVVTGGKKRNVYQVEASVFDLKTQVTKQIKVKVAAANRPAAEIEARKVIERSYPSIQTKLTSGGKDLSGYAINLLSVNRVGSAGQWERGETNQQQNVGPAASLQQGEPRFSELSNPADALLYQQTTVKTRGSRGSRMYVNDHARAVLSAALTEVFQQDYSAMNAINLSRAEAYRVAAYLDREAMNLPGDYKAGAEQLAADIRQMVDSSRQATFNIVDVTPFARRYEAEIPSDRERAVEGIKATIREEGFHWSQRQVSGQSIALVGSSWAQSSKGYAKYRKALLALGYPDDPETIVAETAAKIASGQFDVLGIRTEADHEAAQNWLVSYFDRVAERHGIDALDKFNRLLPKAQEAKKEGGNSAKERFRKRIEEDQAKLRESAGGAVNRPRAPGRESETVQSATTGKPQNSAPEIRRASPDEPFETGETVKGPQIPLGRWANTENVRQPGEAPPPIDGGAGFGGKPPKGPGKKLFSEGEPPNNPEPWKRDPQQRELFDEQGLPKKRWASFWEAFADITNLPKALRASGDISAALRQGFYLSIPPSRWGMAARAMKAQIKSLENFGLWGKGGQYEAFQKTLRAHPAYRMAKAAGVHFSGEGGINAHEEMFASRLAGKMPWVKYSEQAFKAYLDSIRLETFDLYRRTIDAQIKDPKARFEEQQAAADWINVSSGRGSYRGRFGSWYQSKAAPFLNVIGWAPGLVYSRFQLLNPVTYAKNIHSLKNPRSNVVFVKQMSELFQTAAVLTATAALAVGAGATVSFDPDEADFLKIRVGTTRYDVLAGVQQVARLAIKIGRWLETRATVSDSTEAGKKELRKSSRETTDSMLRFARTKLGPVPGFFVDWLNDWRKVTGERHAPGDFIEYAKQGEWMQAAGETTDDPFLSQVMPLFFADVVRAFEKGWRNGGPGNAAIDSAKMIPSALGIGVQDYDRPEYGKPARQALDKYDLEPGFPKRKEGELEEPYQRRVKAHIREQELAIDRFESDSNMRSQPVERAKTLLKQEISSEGIERLSKIKPEDIEDDRMVRAWIQAGLERLKSNPTFQAMSENQQQHAIQSYYGRMNKYKAQPKNSKHGYQAPDVVDDNVLRRRIEEAVKSQGAN